MIDLFAGCGGVSLGFEQAGFAPVFVNELNDDARATYLVNRSHKVGGKPFNTLPHLASSDVNQLDAKRLAQLESDLAALEPTLRFGPSGTIDVLAGGPPCQGYSGIGHRRSYSVDKAELPSNRLYERMAQVIEVVRPRIFLFENVRGLLSARWTANGEKGEIWKDVFDRYKLLAREAGYEVRWQLVLARDYGVPQNRPRVLMVGIRNDVIAAAGSLLDPNAHSESAYACGFLPRYGIFPVPDLVDLFSDLIDPKVQKALVTQEFPARFATDAYPREAGNDIQRYFRPGDLARKGAPLEEQEYSKHAARIVAKFQAMHSNGGTIPAEFQTKKFAQKLLPKTWGNQGPTITACSMPDDYVHFEQPRSSTVREWARIQTFPDWYKFAGKRTTGGIRRAGNPREGNFEREVPKYTQIGNAVPVRLAHAVAVHFDKVLSAAGIAPSL